MRMIRGLDLTPEVPLACLTAQAPLFDSVVSAVLDSKKLEALHTGYN